MGVLLVEAGSTSETLIGEVRLDPSGRSTSETTWGKVSPIAVAISCAWAGSVSVTATSRMTVSGGVVMVSWPARSEVVVSSPSSSTTGFSARGVLSSSA